MVNGSHIKQVDDSDFEVGRKYRYVDVMRKKIIHTFDDKFGLKQDELMSGEEMEQMLNAYLDEHGEWNLNLNSSFYLIGIPDSVVSIYKVPDTMHWTTISYNLYGTTRLAWLLMKLNGVGGKDLFKPVLAGHGVKYLDRGRYVETILGTIRENEGEING